MTIHRERKLGPTRIYMLPVPQISPPESLSSYLPQLAWKKDTTRRGRCYGGCLPLHSQRLYPCILYPPVTHRTPEARARPSKADSGPSKADPGPSKADSGPSKATPKANTDDYPRPIHNQPSQPRPTNPEPNPEQARKPPCKTDPTPTTTFPLYLLLLSSK